MLWVRVCRPAAATVVAGCLGFSGLAAAQTLPTTPKESRVLCVHDIDPPGGLNVHANPTKSAPVTGRFPAKACGIKLTGICVEDWCEMTLGTQTGWVDSRYVAYYDVPAGYPVVEAPAPKRSAGTAAKAAGPQPQSRTATARTARKVSGTERKQEPHQRLAAKPGREGRSRQAQFARGPTGHRSDPTQSIRRHFAEHHAASLSSGFGAYLASAFGSAARLLLGGPAKVHSSARTGCVRRVAANDVLFIRAGPGPGNPAIGSLSSTACGLTLAGTCHGPWCKIGWRGRSGWVNMHYVD